jgi:hypothetical protein
MPDASKVREMMIACLFGDDEPHEAHVEAEGIIHNFRFHPGRIAEHSALIREQLDDLPREFHEPPVGGGGWSFLNACMDRRGYQWGEHASMESLICLGIAAGFVRYCLPRDLWTSLPGGLPYFVVLAPKPSESVN